MIVKPLTVCFGSADLLATVQHVRGVIVDLPKDTLPFMLERAEVMFAMRVVVLGKGVEVHHLGDNRRLLCE